jgi:hypothetical protein
MLAPVVSGCETMERMDYFDRIFDPALRSSPAFIPMRPIPDPGNYPVAAVADPSPQPDVVVAMEPIPNPADHPRPTERSHQSASVRAAEPRPSPAPIPDPAADAEARTRLLVRQNPWVTRFWMELTPAQQSRVERQLLRGNVRPASGQADAAAAWDPMGLADRVGLVFGRGAPLERPEPPAQREGSTLAGSS